WNFWVMFIGFNLGFFPMHIAGLLGMPRRIYTYSDAMGWSGLNLVISAGSYLFAIGVLLFLVNIIRSARHGLPAGPNPWDAATLLLTIALSGLFTGLLLHSWWVAGACTLLTLVAMAAWLWPEEKLGQTAEFEHELA